MQEINDGSTSLAPTLQFSPYIAEKMMEFIPQGKKTVTKRVDSILDLSIDTF